MRGVRSHWAAGKARPGKTVMREGAVVAALVALASALAEGRAWAADPTVAECIAASNASAKLRTEHQLRKAREKLLVCVAASCPAAIREECGRRLERVAAALPTVVFEAKDARGRELTAVKVTMDDEVVAEQLDGKALTLDPGAHRFRFETEGRAAVTETIVMHEGELNRRETVTFELSPADQPAAAPAPAPAASTPPEGSASGHAAFEAAPAAGSGQRRLGLVAGAVGGVALLTGAVFGTLTFVEWGSAQGGCPSHTNCPQAAVNDRNQALTFATVSTVTIAAGAALLAGGLALYATVPKSEGASVGVLLGPTGLVAAGKF